MNVMTGAACSRGLVFLMAFDACRHGCGTLLRNHLAFGDRSMAVIALDVRLTIVKVVREPDIIRHLIDGHPRDRLSVAIVFREFADRGTLGLHSGMAAHTGRFARHTGGESGAGSGMAVNALDSELGMLLVIERDRLLRRRALLSRRR